MYPEKTFRPDNLRLPFHTDREAPQVARCDNPKKYSSRQLPAFGRYFAKSLSSDPLRWPEKVQLQTVFGFWSILFERSLQRPVAMTRKSTAPDSLRLLVNPFRKISPATRCDDLKKSSSRLPSTLDLYWAKSLSSLRRCTPAIRLGLSALGCNKDKRNGAWGL